MGGTVIRALVRLAAQRYRTCGYGESALNERNGIEACHVLTIVVDEGIVKRCRDAADVGYGADKLCIKDVALNDRAACDLIALGREGRTVVNLFTTADRYSDLAGDGDYLANLCRDAVACGNVYTIAVENGYGICLSLGCAAALVIFEVITNYLIAVQKVCHDLRKVTVLNALIRDLHGGTSCKEGKHLWL